MRLFILVNPCSSTYTNIQHTVLLNYLSIYLYLYFKLSVALPSLSLSLFPLQKSCCLSLSHRRRVLHWDDLRSCSLALLLFSSCASRLLLPCRLPSLRLLECGLGRAGNLHFHISRQDLHGELNEDSPSERSPLPNTLVQLAVVGRAVDVDPGRPECGQETWGEAEQREPELDQDPGILVLSRNWATCAIKQHHDESTRAYT